MNRIKRVWQTRTLREQRLLLMGGISLIVALIFSAWQQLDLWRDHQRWTFEQEKRAVSGLIAQEAEMPSPPQGATLEDIAQRASKYGLTLPLAPTQNGFTLISAQQVDFQPLMQLLAQLENCCALGASQLVYERHDEQRMLTTLELTHGE